MITNAAVFGTLQGALEIGRPPGGVGRTVTEGLATSTIFRGDER